MELYSYNSRDTYVQAQLERTEAVWFAGRRLAHHIQYINELLRCLINLSWLLPADARIVCMGVRRGIEMIAWEWKGYQNVLGVDLSSRRDYRNIISADFSHLEKFLPDQSCDVIYACHSFEHTYDPKATAEEWKRILKPNGVIWISLPTTMGERYSPSEVHPVVINQVSDFEDLFDPLRVVWTTTEGFQKGSFNINVILLNPNQKGPAASRSVRREMRRKIRRGVRLSRMVRRFSKMLKRLTGPDRDYEIEICLWIERLSGFLSRKEKVSPLAGLKTQS